jgi:hypothetical protein
MSDTFTEQQMSLFHRMEAYATRFESAGKPQHAEVIRGWIQEIRTGRGKPCPTCGGYWPQ